VSKFSKQTEGLLNSLRPNRKAFEADPIGYSALAWHQWALAQSLAGFPVDLESPPSRQELNLPVLWMTHAHAMAEAAKILIQNNPNLDHLPINISGVCDSQYCAVGLMLVAYSLEISLKAMLIIKNGTDAYLSEQKKYQHHRLEKLAEFVPNLNAKDKAILQALTHFSTWAGRYPDPGLGREKHSQKVFELAEQNQITAKELFHLSARIMRHAQQVVEES